MARKKTHEEFVREVEKLTDGEYEVIGNYINNKTPIEMKHIKCNRIYTVRPDCFIHGDRCALCSGKLKKTTESFKDEVFKLIGDEYEVMGEYTSTHTKIALKHNCGNVFEMSPRNFLRGQRCPKCQHRSYVKTDNEFKHEVYNLVLDEYEVVGKYINGKTKIKMLHKTCNTEYEVCPSDFIQGDRCPNCFRNYKLTQEEFENRVRLLFNEEYTVIGKYINFATKIKIKHNDCGYSWDVLSRDFLSDKSHCPKCNYSKGEKRISIFLKENKINNIPQYSFDNLKGIRGGLLSYDFYLPDFNMLVEYQGEFHDGNGNYHMKRNLERQQEHDKRKKEYAENNNIKLLEIWYWDFDNIEEILKNTLFN